MVLALGLSMTAAFLLVEWRLGRPRERSGGRLHGEGRIRRRFESRIERPRRGGAASGEARR